MEKSPEAFRTISEVAETLATPAHVLRFWESRFPQIRPVKRAGGRRYYRPADVALLAGIKRLLHSEGLTIRGVQKLLREQGVRHVAALGDPDNVFAEAFAGGTDGVAAIESPAAAGEATSGPVAGSGTDSGTDSVMDLGLDSGMEPVAGPETEAAAGPVPPAPPCAAPRDAGETVAEESRTAAPRAAGRLQTPAARLRALPPGSLAARRHALAELAGRMAALRERLSRA